MSAKATPPWAFLEDEDEDDDEDESEVANGWEAGPALRELELVFSKNSACTILTSQLSW